MIEIIKSKGICFVFRRIFEKIRKRVDNSYLFYQDKKSCTYSQDIENFTDFCTIYNANEISYDLLDNELIIKLADNICDHNFNLLGSGIVNVSYKSNYKGFEGNHFENILKFDSLKELIDKEINFGNREYCRMIANHLPKHYKPIDWQVDFKSGYRWGTYIYFSEIRYGNNPGAEVKIPWDFGRLNHFIILFYAWKLTKQDKYLEEFVKQFYDFSASNPPRFGIQWSSPMDVALRGVNLASVYSLFITAGASFGDDFAKLYISYLYDHLLHIINNLEWSSGMRANHYYSNVCGILYLCAFLPVTEVTSKIFALAINEFQSETLYQFNSDGSNFEGSLPYHNFVSEILFQTYLMLNRLNSDKIGKLSKFSGSIKSNDFKINNDILKRNLSNNLYDYVQNGKIVFSEEFKFRIKEVANFTLSAISESNYDFNIGDEDSGYFFRIIPCINSDLSIEAKNRLELKKFANYISGNYHPPKSMYFQDFGIYFNTRSKYEIAIRCGKLGQNGKGGHSHNDSLSFELLNGNNLLICDPGTFCYTSLPKQRNHFRSTIRHNTLIIHGFEQNPIKNEYSNLFWLMDHAKAKCIKWNNDEFSGVHYGYNLPHERTFSLYDSRIEIKDKCEIAGDKHLHIHLTNDAKIIRMDNNSVRLGVNNSEFEIKSSTGKITLEDYFYSREYGVKYSSNLVVITFSENEIIWEIEIK